MWTATALLVLLFQVPLDLAAIQFRAGNYSEARSHLHRALRIDAEDPYANNFLATLYLLDDNVEAALKYWNRIGKPYIGSVSTDTPVQTDPILWDRSFAFSPAGTLRLEAFQDTKARLQSLDVFSRIRFELVPAGENFDVVVRPLMRGGTGANGKWGTIAGLARGLPYQTVELDFPSVHSSGLNISSLLRWDPEKRRAFFGAAMPVQRNPQRRFDVALDVRQETWKRVKLSAGLRSQVNGRWSWGSRVNLSTRKSANPGDRGGTLLTYEAAVDHRMLSLPEHRFAIDTGASFEFGRDFTRASSRTVLQWFPQAATDDYEATVIFRFGKLGGRAPFDEWFVLGLDRDHDLLLRGHSATPGSGFGLVNIDLQKKVLKQGLFTVAIGPFLDVARITEADRLFIDTGLQLRLSLISGLTLGFSYGRDVHSGRNAFFYR